MSPLMILPMRERICPVLDIDVFDLVLDGLFVVGQILVYVAGAVHVVLTFKRVQRITDMLFQFRDVLIEPIEDENAQIAYVGCEAF